MEPVCTWRWSGLKWNKIVPCPPGDQTFCPEPEGVGGFPGDGTTTPCGGP